METSLQYFSRGNLPLYGTFKCDYEDTFLDVHPWECLKLRVTLFGVPLSSFSLEMSLGCFSRITDLQGLWNEVHDIFLNDCFKRFVSKTFLEINLWC